MKRIAPLHSRANILPRPDIHADLHGLMVKDGVIDSALFGKVRMETPVHYQTPAPRDSFAFGEIAALGSPATEDRGKPSLGLCPGDIIGFDLHQTGHEIDASPYYEKAPSFYTLPWKEIACRFGVGCDLPDPVGWWVMLAPDDIQTQRLVFGTTAGGGIHLPGAGSSGGMATNRGKKTKVRLAAGKLLSLGALAGEAASGYVEQGDWLLYNPLDCITILYTRDPSDTSSTAQKRKLAFVKWDSLEQVVKAD